MRLSAGISTTASMALLASLAVATVGCSDRESRKVAGGYCLDRMFEGDHYNLTSCWGHSGLTGLTDNGPMDGTIAKLGWDSRYILAWRVALSRADPDGWMLLDVANDTLEPLITDTALAERKNRSPEVARLVVHDVQTAWQLLGQTR